MRINLIFAAGSAAASKLPAKSTKIVENLKDLDNFEFCENSFQIFYVFSGKFAGILISLNLN